MSPDLAAGLAQFAAGGTVPGGDGGMLLRFRDPRKPRPEPVPFGAWDQPLSPYVLQEHPFFMSPDFAQGVSQWPAAGQQSQVAPQGMTPADPNWLQGLFHGLLSIFGG